MTIAVPLAIYWMGGLALALADGRRRAVGWMTALLLGAGFVATVFLASEVLANGALQIVAGNWSTGIGITLRADMLGVVFALTASAVILAAFCYELSGGIESRSFPALTLFLAAGLTGLFLTGDAFNFYVFFEIAMISSYILVAYGEGRRQLRAAVTFAVVNLLGSVLFLMGIVSLYHVTGTLDMASIANRMLVVEENPAIVAGTLLFVALCVKLGIFPFHFWLPAVYTGVHASVAAMLSGALAIIGSYGFLRIGAGMLPRELALAAPVLIVLGVTSILYGGIQAVSRHESAAVVAYSSIGQVGYIFIAIAAGGPVGLAAAILFTVLNSLNKTLLFLSGDQRNRYAGMAYAIGGLSVAGVPIAAGFWSKAALFRSSMVAGTAAVQALLTTIIVVGGLLSILYMFQSYGRVFWHAEPFLAGKGAAGRAGIALIVAIIVIAIGIWPEPLFNLTDRAAITLQPELP